MVGGKSHIDVTPSGEVYERFCRKFGHHMCACGCRCMRCGHWFNVAALIDDAMYRHRKTLTGSRRP